ncbi:MAG: Peptidase M50 [Parcubacteria group bacterium GW2011_GWC2_52_8c]|nr:MAG: Peptidase M50 [Parcubacteria group bacterium GW2011_GWC2_52_8c]
MLEIVFIVIIYFFSIVIHEVAHGAAAYMLGDPTAKNAGRLTLNPLPHIDPFGTVLLPLVMALPAFFGARPLIFGWARPVPFNPMFFKNIRRGTFLVSIAGVSANLSLAIIFSVFLRFLDPLLSGYLSAVMIQSLATVFSTVVIANLVLGIFNLFPIPPLDGSRVLFSLLPDRFTKLQMMLEQYGLFLLIALIVFLPELLSSLVFFAFRLLVGA